METPIPREVTRVSVLDAVIARLWDADEGELRIADVCAETGLSSSVIYNNYRSRQGLIDAAYLEIYRTMTDQLVAIFQNVAAESADIAAVARYVHEQITVPATHEFWAKNRQIRLRIATAAIARPSLQRDFVLLQDHYLNRLTELFTDMQRRHLAGDLLKPRQLAIMFEGCLLFRSFNDIALHPVDNDSWLEMLMSVLGACASRTP